MDQGGQENPAFQSDSCEECSVHIEIHSKPDNVKEPPNHATYTNTHISDSIPQAENGIHSDIDNKETSKVEGDSICNRGRSLLYKRRGLLLATGAAFFFSAENIFMELTTLHLDIFQTGATMGAIVLLLTFICAVITKKQIPSTKEQYFSLLISGIFLAVGLPLALESLKNMEVGDSITIIYTMPIFSGIFSWIILREPLRLIDFLFALLSFGGVILVARPPFIFRGDENDIIDGEDPLLGSLYALGSAVSFALVVVAARKQSFIGLHPIIILLFNSIVILVTNAIVCTITHQWQIPSTKAWGYLLGLGFSDFCAQILIYMAVVVEVAMYVNIVSTSEVIMTFLWQFIFFSVAPGWMSAIGATLILVACVGMATKKDASAAAGTHHHREDSNVKRDVTRVSEGIANDAASVEE